MTGNDFRQAFKWLLIAAMIMAAWCGVIAVRKARADMSSVALADRNMSTIERSQEDAKDLRPVWVIVVFETKNDKIIGITEFVFASYDACRDGAVEAKHKLGLHLLPVCYLRWLKALPGPPA